MTYFEKSSFLFSVYNKEFTSANEKKPSKKKQYLYKKTTALCINSNDDAKTIVHYYNNFSL